MIIRPGAINSKRSTFPEADHNFSFNGTLPEGFTIARASSATYFDADGYIQEVASNAPRFQDGGLIIEGEARTNLIPESDLSGFSALRTSLTADATVNRIVGGGAGALACIPNTIDSSHYIARSIPKAAEALTYTFSLYIKPNPNAIADGVEVRLRGDGANRLSLLYLFNSDGTLQNKPAVTEINFTFIRQNVEECPNGWYRISMTGTTDTHTSVVCRVWGYKDGSNNYVGDAETPDYWIDGAQLELAQSASTLIITSGASATRASERVSYDGSIGNTAEGMIVTDYRPLSIDPNMAQYQNIWYLDHDSDSSRLDCKIRTDLSNTVWSALTDSSGDNTSAYPADSSSMQGIRQKHIVSWSVAESELWAWHNGQFNPRTISSYEFTDTKWDTLYLGSRNSVGSDPLHCIIYSIKIYNKYYKNRQAITVGGVQSGLSFMATGQSNQARKKGDNDDDNGGEKGAYAVLDKYTNGAHNLFVIDAIGGTPIFKSGTTSAPTRYFINDDAGDDPSGWIFEGDTADEVKEAIDAGFMPYSGITWNQGEADATAGTAKSKYIDGLRFIQEQISAYAGLSRLPFYIEGLGVRDEQTYSDNTQVLREAQQEACELYDDMHMVCYWYDLEKADSVHAYDDGDEDGLEDDAFYIMAKRTMRRVLKLKGYDIEGATIGPSVNTVTRDGTTVTVTLTHDVGADDFTPSTGIRGFKFTDDGVNIAVNSAVRTDATTVTLTLASEPSGEEVLYYIYGHEFNIDNDDLGYALRDNSKEQLPLQPFKVIL